MNLTEINWTELTWNPASGCDIVSTECKYCYAQTLAENKRGTRAFPNGFDITMRPWKLDEPRKVKRPSLIFTNSMTDMFHDGIPDSYRDQVVEAMNANSRHRYQVLTKRPENARRYFATRKVPDSMWLGVTVGHSSTMWRVDMLREIDARVRFISAEPILSDLPFDLSGIHWLISGGESVSHLSDLSILDQRAIVRRGDMKAGERRYMPREDRMHWIRNLRDICNAAGVAYWFKQWGGPTPKSGGRDLDGRTWDEMPTLAGALPEGYDHRSVSIEKKRQLALLPSNTIAS
jgi:protein gp37